METNSTKPRKEYIKPQIEVVKIQQEGCLLTASNDDPYGLPDHMDVKVH